MLYESRLPENLTFADGRPRFDDAQFVLLVGAVLLLAFIFALPWLRRVKIGRRTGAVLAAGAAFLVAATPVAWLFPRAAATAVNMVAIVFLIVVPAVAAVVAFVLVLRKT